MVKECELCGVAARMYCESDQASLCWDCDEKVHSANFLVAKHSRTLLCHVCHSQTPWKASGSKLGPTVSICHSCLTSSDHLHRDGEDEEVVSRGESDDNLYEDEDDDDDDDESVGEEEDEEEGENQVVPWSAVASPSPPVASSSSSEGEISSGVGVKRSRGGFEDDSRQDLDSDDEPAGSYTSQSETGRLTARDTTVSDAILPALRNSVVSVRQRKQSRIGSGQKDNNGQAESSGSGGSSSRAMTIETFKRLQQRETVSGGEDAAATILGICRLSRDQGL